ncbi:MAG: hypothetical protein ABT01_03235 [Clostridium sp. SCN 57-10]|nr:MAG: hypothetical protein ABT01_03235 [Clostridium sp. SCN 57-10]
MKYTNKLDEMEQYIALKSLKIAYWFTVTFLVIWTIVDVIIQKNIYSIPLILLASQNIILTFFDRYFKRKLSESDNDK